VWALAVDDDLELVLAEPRWAGELTEMTDRNRPRLAQWESWALTTATVDSNRGWLRECAEGWARGEQAQTFLRSGGRLVGSAGLRFDQVREVAELGYWIDGDSEGRGLVTRAASALVALALGPYGMLRVEVRTSVGNTRSRAVAERLGFVHEGTLRRAYRIGDRVDDVAVYGLVAGHDEVGVATS
jgi:ribosomal-protein-serine acetyltransferase